MELSRIAKITRSLLFLFFGVGSISLFFVNHVVKFLGLPNPTGYTVIIILIGLCCLFIVFQAIKVFSSIVEGNPFVRKNEIALKKIACSCEFIAFILIIKLFINTSVFFLTSLLLIGVFAIAGLCAYVFSQLFKLSVFLKEENDMTI